MNHTRRLFLAGAGATAAVVAARGTGVAAAAAPSGLAGKVVGAWDKLPGKKALKIVALPAGNSPQWSASLNPEAALFCGSAFKTFVLCEYLRQTEAGTTSLHEQLALDESVWVPGSEVFNPPNLSGKVTAQTVLEAMISHSDNTATDMAIQRVGVDRIREFISSIGLHHTTIPNSIRQFYGYVSGYPDWQHISWAKIVELSAATASPYPGRSLFNDTITMAISPNDFVSYYSRALQGAFFKKRETLATFMDILALNDFIGESMPLGVNCFMKGGSADNGDEHAACVAGGFFVDRWFFFGMSANWTTAQGGTVAQLKPRFAATIKQIVAWIRDSFD